MGGSIKAEASINWKLTDFRNLKPSAIVSPHFGPTSFQWELIIYPRGLDGNASSMANIGARPVIDSVSFPRNLRRALTTLNVMIIRPQDVVKVNQQNRRNQYQFAAGGGIGPLFKLADLDSYLDDDGSLIIAAHVEWIEDEVIDKKTMAMMSTVSRRSSVAASVITNSTMNGDTLPSSPATPTTPQSGLSYTPGNHYTNHSNHDANNIADSRRSSMASQANNNINNLYNNNHRKAERRTSVVPFVNNSYTVPPFATPSTPPTITMTDIPVIVTPPQPAFPIAQHAVDVETLEVDLGQPYNLEEIPTALPETVEAMNQYLFFETLDPLHRPTTYETRKGLLQISVWNNIPALQDIVWQDIIEKDLTPSSAMTIYQMAHLLELSRGKLDQVCMYIKTHLNDVLEQGKIVEWAVGPDGDKLVLGDLLEKVMNWLLESTSIPPAPAMSNKQQEEDPHRDRAVDMKRPGVLESVDSATTVTDCYIEQQIDDGDLKKNDSYTVSTNVESVDKDRNQSEAYAFNAKTIVDGRLGILDHSQNVLPHEIKMMVSSIKVSL